MACKGKTITVCPVGEGYAEGSNVADDSKCTACTASTFNSKSDDSACLDKTVTSCGLDQKLQSGTAVADDASCISTVTANSPSPSKNAAAGVAGAGFSPSPSPSPSTTAEPSQKAAVLKKDTGAAQAAANDLNKNNGTLTTAEATKKRTEIIKDIGELVLSSGNGGATGTSNDLAGASQQEKQEVLGAIVGALSSAVANPSQLNGPSGGSEIARVLLNMTLLANDIEGTFDTETTGRVMDTISTVLDVRGASLPDDAIDKIDSIITNVVNNNPANAISVKTNRVALGSSTTALSLSSSSSSASTAPRVASGWLAAFSSSSFSSEGTGAEDGSAASSWQEEVQNMTAKSALVALDEPVRVQFDMELAASDTARQLSAKNSARTTVVQYSGGRNPYWPSPFSSSDIITLSISRTSVTRVATPDGVGTPTRRLRPLDDNWAANTVASVINVTFETSTPLWTWWGVNRTVSGTASLPPEGAVAYQTEDVCGNKVAHRANTARFSATDNPQVWWVWCAWWNTETRGWHTEGCTITDLSMTFGIGNGIGGRDAVVQCECVMPSDASQESFKGSFGVIKENKEDQEKRLENKKGDAGSLVGYIFKRIAESFNFLDIPFELIPSAAYLCGIPLAIYLVVLLYLRARVCCKCCPGYKAYHQRHAGDSASNLARTQGPVANRHMSENEKRRMREAKEDTADGGIGAAPAVVVAPPPLEDGVRPGGVPRRRLQSHRTSGKQEYSKEYWKKHHDGMKTHPVIKRLFGMRTIVDHSTDRFWKCYWQFLVRNHDTLAPFLAPHDPGRGHTFYMSILLAKYAACVAAGTVLYHLHACFKLSAAMGVNGMLGDSSWWQGKAMLAALSLVMQKVPITMLSLLFQSNRKRQRSLAMHLKPYKLCGLFKLGRAFTIVPWFAFFLLVVGCFGVTIILTSTGFLQGASSSPGDDTAQQCGCASTTAGKDVEGDWITLLLMIVLFRTFVYRPSIILLGTVVFLASERRTRKMRRRAAGGNAVELSEVHVGENKTPDEVTSLATTHNDSFGGRASVVFDNPISMRRESRLPLESSEQQGNGAADGGGIDEARQASALSHYSVQNRSKLGKGRSSHRHANRRQSRKETFHAPAIVKGRGISFRKCSCAEGEYYENLDTGETTWTLPSGSFLVGPGDGNDEDDLGGGAAHVIGGILGTLGEEDGRPAVLRDPEEVGEQNAKQTKKTKKSSRMVAHASSTVVEEEKDFAEEGDDGAAVHIDPSSGHPYRIRRDTGESEWLDVEEWRAGRLKSRASIEV